MQDRTLSGDPPIPLTAAQVRRAVTRLARRLRPHGSLSATKISVLGHLYRHGPSTAGEVAAAEHHQPQSLTRVFTELVTEGLISRSRGDVDRRQSVLELTEAGAATLRGEVAERDEWLAAALGKLTGAEVQIVHVAAALLERLAEHDVAGRSEAGRDDIRHVEGV
ncbi:MarR family winged helix-turn-helix transcriptional regulator [Actinoplanes sp. RD1]|uniref:MarR family winged helix-turn-helix transcriptional regulator n=1 Tax=Actinoplanes sp. RD1 TaxID=3064538 RepID=UPI002740A26C|nr:MarR family transcriptional regulator [Actinoplanes sp. RD1]